MIKLVKAVGLSNMESANAEDEYYNYMDLIALGTPHFCDYGATLTSLYGMNHILHLTRRIFAQTSFFSVALCEN